MSHIRTKWHLLKELLQNDDVIYTTGSSKHSLTATHHSDVDMKLEMLRLFVEHAEEKPKFVFDKELLELADNADFKRSLLDMKKAGVLKLPYQDVIVEFQAREEPNNHFVVFVGQIERDGPDSVNKMFPNSDICGVAFNICRDEHGDYLAIPLTIAGLCLEEINGEPWVNIVANPTKWCSKSELSNQVVENTFNRDAMNVGVAWYLICLIMATRGIEKEAIEAEKLNRHRRKSGKPSIPKHTYIRIGHVYQKDGSHKKYDERKSPRPHWRRGHIRNVRHGKGKAETKPIWIEAMLVAYAGDEFTAKRPDYVAK